MYGLSDSGVSNSTRRSNSASKKKAKCMNASNVLAPGSNSTSMSTSLSRLCCPRTKEPKTPKRRTPKTRM